MGWWKKRQRPWVPSGAKAFMGERVRRLCHSLNWSPSMDKRDTLYHDEAARYSAALKFMKNECFLRHSRKNSVPSSLPRRSCISQKTRKSVAWSSHPEFLMTNP